MGIVADNLLWIRPHVAPGLSMLELGSQYLYVAAPPWPGYPPEHLNPTMTAPVPAKALFASMGVDHVSIDLNGELGALPLDLAAPLDLGWRFDLITDFGTSEHIRDLWRCLWNVHDHGRPGAKMFHSNPEPGSWPGHGFWTRSRAFYEQLAALAGYTILDLRRAAACGNEVDGWETRCLLVRGEAPFPSREAFARLPLTTT